MAKTGQTSDLKILIVEDDEVTIDLIKVRIENYCKNVLIAKNGKEAVQVCRNNPGIDLILMDINMPEIDGYEATYKIRKFDKDVIIFAQTAYALSGDKEMAIKTGCNDYISKPFSYDSFSVLIEKYFNKKKRIEN